MDHGVAIHTTLYQSLGAITGAIGATVNHKNEKEMGIQQIKNGNYAACSFW